jgi:hypothetical protein
MRSLRTGLDALLAADAFCLVDDPDIAVLSVDMSRTGGAILDAQRRNALPADRHTNVEWVLGE